MNDYPDGQGKEKDSRYLSATRRGAQLKNSLVVVAYAGFSAALLLSLKYAISGQYWNLNLYLLALQSGCAVAGIWLLRLCGYPKEFVGLKLRKAMIWLPLSILLGGSNYLSYTALQYLSLPTYILLSTTTIFTVPCIESILFGTPIPPSAFKSYLLIYSGIIVSVITENAHAEASYGDRRVEQGWEQDPAMILFLGYVFMVAHLFLYSIYIACKGKLSPYVKFGQWDVFFYNHLLMLIIASPLSFFIEDFSDENMYYCFPSEHRHSNILAITYTCVGMFPVLFFSTSIVQKFSQSTFSIVEASIKMVIATLGMHIYSYPMNVGSVSPIVIGCSGGIFGAWLEGRHVQDVKGKRVLPA